MDEIEIDPRHPADGSGATWPIFEVFRQEREGQAMQHAGNVSAPDVELAVLYAKEFYSRRNESVRLWVMPRAEIREIVDMDLLRPPAVDRSYRSVAGYTMRDKLEAARVRGARDMPGSATGTGQDKAVDANPASVMTIPQDV